MYSVLNAKINNLSTWNALTLFGCKTGEKFGIYNDAMEQCSSSVSTHTLKAQHVTMAAYPQEEFCFASEQHQLNLSNNDEVLCWEWQPILSLL